MVLTIAAFEVRQRLRRISTYIYFLVFLTLSIFFVCMAGGAVSGASVDFGTGGKIWLNSPYALNVITMYVTFLGIVVTGAIAGQATYQDIDSHIKDLFYTAPITKFDYLAGRFLGALVVQILIFSSIGIGAYIGMRLPWLDQSRLGPNNAVAYLQPYLNLVLPNLVLTTAIFFGLAASWKKMLPVYVGSVLMLIGYFTAAQLSTNLNVNTIDGSRGPVRRHRCGSSNPILEPLPAQYPTDPALRHSAFEPYSVAGTGRNCAGLNLLKIFPFLSFAARRETSSCAECRHPRSRESRSACRAFRFLLQRLVAAVLFLDPNSLHGDGQERLFPGLAAGWWLIRHSCRESNYQSVLQPYLSRHLPDARGRNRRSLRVRTRDYYVLCRGVGVARARRRTEPDCGRFAGTAMGALQFETDGFAAGTNHFGPGDYGRRDHRASHARLSPLRIWTLLHRSVCDPVVPVLDDLRSGFLYPHVGEPEIPRALRDGALLCEHAGTAGHGPAALSLSVRPVSSLHYSDMNGYGPFAASLFWFHLYWGIAAIALAIITNTLWVRGTGENLWARLQVAATRFTRPGVASLLVCAVLLVAVGGYIFYNTNILNPYYTTYAIDEGRAQYEKKYRQYKDLPQPKITDINTQIDLDPANRSVNMRGTMMLENKTSSTIDRVAITVLPVDLAPVPPPHREIHKLEFRWRSDGASRR